MKHYEIDELYVGLSESFKVTLEEEMMNKFLEISGDNNPLHIDNEFAKAKNFDKRVVYGMLTSSFYSRLVGVYLPGEKAILRGIDIKFHKPVYENDELLVYGEVSYINAEYKIFEIKASITNADGKKVSKAKISVGLQ